MLWWGLRLVLPLAAGVLEGWAVALGALLFQEAGLWLSRRLGGDFGRKLFLGAYGLRVLVALPSHYFAKLQDGNGSIFQDAYTNDLVAEWTLRILRGDGISIFAGHQHVLDSSYTYFLVGLYALFGHAPLLPKLLNCAIGGLCAVFVFEIGRQAFSVRAGQLAGIGAAVMPTLVLWSIVTLKESLVLLIALAGLWAIQRLIEGAEPRRAADLLVLLIVLMVLSLDLRATTTAIFVLLLAVVFTRRAQPSPRAWQLGLAGLSLACLVGGGVFVARLQATGRPPSGVVEDIVLQIRHRRAQEAAAARSQIRPENDVLTAEGRREIPVAEAISDATPFSVADDVLNPLGYALLAPAPWQARSASELAASGEMLIWDVLLIAAFFAWRLPPRQRLFVVCLIAYGVANWLVLAVSEGNLGNLMRHRLMLAPTLLILGSAGLEWLWLNVAPSRLTARWPAIDVRSGTPVES